jgi:hypothetical protein
MTATHHFPLTTCQRTNSHAAQRTSLAALGKSFWRNRRCLTQARGARLAGKARRARVDVVHLVCLVQPNKRERPDKQERPAAPRVCGALLQGIQEILLRREKCHGLVLGVRLTQKATAVEIDVHDVRLA